MTMAQLTPRVVHLSEIESAGIGENDLKMVVV